MEAHETARSTLRSKGQLTLPAAIRELLRVEEDDQVVFSVNDAGDVIMRGYRSFPTDQTWFWSPAWQEGEQQASDELKNGITRRFDNDADFLASLDGEG